MTRRGNEVASARTARESSVATQPRLASPGAFSRHGPAKRIAENEMEEACDRRGEAHAIYRMLFYLPGHASQNAPGIFAGGSR